MIFNTHFDEISPCHYSINYKTENSKLIGPNSGGGELVQNTRPLMTASSILGYSLKCKDLRSLVVVVGARLSIIFSVQHPRPRGRLNNRATPIPIRCDGDCVIEWCLAPIAEWCLALMSPANVWRRRYADGRGLGCDVVMLSASLATAVLLLTHEF